MIRINEKIIATELLVIDEAGEKVGVLPLAEALALAKEKGLDLIEVAPMANPPVAKIMNFDKYRYQEIKKQKKQRAQQKVQELKQVRISGRSAQHDLEVKAKRVDEFLNEGNLVEIQLTLKGREKAHKDWAKQKLLDFIKMINPEHKVILEPRYGGRGFSMQVIKK
ncbi:MAG: translation initiation factor IF-3 [Candidatus Harrisonbacteria bacterium RIFCSPLOWO2_02_FULL_41_11]|uniref:Translation initiation factor IF-3 n=1 Tax=Candidatus Harrisonbacteria bacterium RIFCSPHIGHO2_02_FULL_42_16 TaxID=1798404 RepID=A0A1G1ZJY2_9BACT|nr:MAG: translation initiation factor IF-3 [Candidatus Harrisonbacteria bacterium RIFCSPHIGHO2_02_FULL_42_16]OGY67163.1 MAG: translation initiation factor IF-3 [Candidatus Harrisonbacteria bacterium RIFCSPLOWO2_02_FULL_41_11]